MRYKIISDNNYDKNIKYEILKSRGIKDIDAFFNIGKHNIEDFHKYDNMQEGYELLMDSINNNEKIGILQDCDQDGISSASFTYQDIKDINPDIEIVYFLQDGKQHGLDNANIMKQILKSKINLLICPDSSSNDYEQHKILKEKNIKVLVLDHHECTHYSKDAVVINNQLSKKVENKEFSGVGVTYKFFQYVDEKNNTNYANKYLDILALGLCADSMDFRQLETRYYFYEGAKRKNIKNEFLKEMMIKYKCQSLNPEVVGWTISPKINATIRYGKTKDKKDMFRAFVGEQEEIKYQPRRKHKEDEQPDIEIHSLQTTMARVVLNIKQNQDKKVKEGLIKIKEMIERKELYKNKVIIVDVTELLTNTFTGLVANKLVGIYKRPIILLRVKDIKKEKTEEKEDLICTNSNDITYGGSARCPDKFTVEDFRQFLLDSKYFIMCEGHAKAFGVEIKKENINTLEDYLNKQFKEVEIDFDEYYEVDYEIPIEDINNQTMKSIADLEDTWGNKVTEPTFAITNIVVKRKDIKDYGDNMKFIKFFASGIDFLYRFASQDILDKINMKPEKGFNKIKEIELEIIGKFKNNEYNGKVTQQIEIIDFNVKEYKKKENKEKISKEVELEIIEDDDELANLDW